MDEKQMVSTNALAKQLDAAVKAAHPQFAGKFEAEAAAAGIAVTAAPSIEGFCALCVKVRGFLNMAIKAIGLFNPAMGQMAKTFMTVLYGTLIPLVCAPK